jgi:hypothetical protein
VLEMLMQWMWCHSLFNHRNQSLTAWLTDEYMGGAKYGLGNKNVDGFFLVRFVSFRFVRSCLCFLLHVRLSPLVPLCLSVSPLVLSSVSHRHRYYCRQDDNWHNSPSEEAWPISRKQHAISSLIYATRRDNDVMMFAVV